MSEQETCAPIGYPRVQNMFSFDSYSKEIIQLKQTNSYPQADMYHPFYSRILIVNLNEIKFLIAGFDIDESYNYI